MIIYFNFYYSKKDTCKLALDAIRYEFATIKTMIRIHIINEYDINNIVTDVPFSFHLKYKKKRITNMKPQ